VQKFNTWIVDYSFDGKLWEMHIKAANEVEAMERVARAAAFGKVSGRQVLSIPIPFGMSMLRLWAWITGLAHLRR
jgi:hypothetical protein